MDCYIWDLNFIKIKFKFDIAKDHTLLTILNDHQIVVQSNKMCILDYINGQRTTLRISKIGCITQLPDERLIYGIKEGYVKIYNLETNQISNFDRIFNIIDYILVLKDKRIVISTHKKLYVY